MARILDLFVAFILCWGCCHTQNNTTLGSSDAPTTTPPAVTTSAPITTVTQATTAVSTQGPTTSASPASAEPPSTSSTTNSTLPTSNGTTGAGAGGNTTAPPTGRRTTIPPTTTLVQTTPTPATIWEVVGRQDNKTCQKMQFNADITTTYDNTDGKSTTVTVSIPSTSNATGDCSSAVERTFNLAFVPEGGVEPWTLSFFFSANKTSKIYQLKSLTVQLSYEDLINSTGKGQPKYFFSSPGRPLAGINAPSGKAFACDSGRVQSEGKEQLSVLLTQLRMQPFANEASGDFGESVQCPYPMVPPSVTQEPMDSTWMNIGIAFIVLFGVLFIATAAFCIYVKKHKSQSSDTYSLMETY